MAEVSYDGDLEDTGAQPDSGGDLYDDGTGGYTGPDGTTGYSSFSSQAPEVGDEGENYPASMGAALAVGGGILELVAPGVVAGLGISEGWASFIDGFIFGANRGGEIDDMIFGDE